MTTEVWLMLAFICTGNVCEQLTVVTTSSQARCEEVMHEAYRLWVLEEDPDFLLVCKEMRT